MKDDYGIQQALPAQGTRLAFTKRRRQTVIAYLYLSPFLIGFILFIGGPMVASLILSFTKFDIVKPMQYIGLTNYFTAFRGDKLFWTSLGRTFYYAGAMVPLSLAGSLSLAILLNQRVHGTSVFRTCFFLPHLTPIVASAILWMWILHPEVGLVNYLLSLVGIKGPAWLGSKEWAIPSMILIGLWMGVGGNAMIIFLAGLQGVPQELYEAAEMDGANSWARFRHVTFPMLTPTVLFNFILGVIGALRVFALAFVSTQGGPARATWFFALHIYMNAFKYFNFGYAAALAWIFFAVIFIFTYLQLRYSGRWVYYAGG